MMGMSCKDGKGVIMDNGKYVRYTPEQVEALERLYHDCPKPTSIRRQQLIRECPIISNIDPKQIKVWFQNRRCREKQRKEASRLQAVNRKLTAMNKLLMEENDRLQKQVSHLVYDNGYFRQHTQNSGLPTKDTSCESVVTSGQHHLKSQHPPRDASPAGLLSIAEETLTEFISKATGTAVEWVQMPGMKPGPDSIGIVAISHGCTGVAARACGLVGLEPTRVAEILKDRPSWFRDCRAVDVLNVLPTANGGTIELLYMQLYAPTTLAPARDFWLIRYTVVMEDGSLVVCERSLNNTQNGPSMPAVQNFVRAEMLPSGYLIRPCEGGGSIIHIVDHMNLEAWSVPQVLRPLYESSTMLAQKTTMMALRQLRQITHEASQSCAPNWICQSYRCYLGVELLLKSGSEESEAILKSLWHHSDAVMCCFIKTSPVFTFANQAGLDMLETTLAALQQISLEKLFDDHGKKSLNSEFPQIMQQGFACLQGGICLSSMGRPVSYERAVAWKVLNEEGNAQCICFMFVNWSFV